MLGLLALGRTDAVCGPVGFIVEPAETKAGGLSLNVGKPTLVTPSLGDG